VACLSGAVLLILASINNTYSTSQAEHEKHKNSECNLSDPKIMMPHVAVSVTRTTILYLDFMVYFGIIMTGDYTGWIGQKRKRPKF